MARLALILGLIAPIALFVLGLRLNERDLVPINGPLSAGVGIALIGVVTGLLIRRWWSVLYAPVVFGVPWVIYLTLTGYSTEPGDTTPLGSFLLATTFLLLMSLPYAIGAFLGTALGRVVAPPDDGRLLPLRRQRRGVASEGRPPS